MESRKRNEGEVVEKKIVNEKEKKKDIYWKKKKCGISGEKCKFVNMHKRKKGKIEKL